ncbi:26S proteasome regulatory subunit 7 [Varroa jacobsoni]|uniref:26S proteasome regulatory subunit 7 n=1 Tax=Varroa destructor TaxID=109461 RepID=A0A7M7K2V4_VARDE|nr:26S proteasome regulatory subunit 7 [Varroa destructor]XP_022697816.1 26S proteasome regulatory subunit 7 [Varroa jacobsoni]
MPDYFGDNMRKQRNSGDEKEEEIKVLDEGDIALLKTYGAGQYSKAIKQAEEDMQAILKRVNELTGIKESDTGLAPPALWDLAADKQTLQNEQPLQVARCTKIIKGATGEDASGSSETKYMINVKQFAKFVVDLADTVAPTDIEEGMRVGVDRNKYQIHIPLPPKIDPTVTMMQVEDKPDVTYTDVGGCKEQIDKLREVVETPLLHPERFVNLGIEPPKGVLLFGPPGTGKTLCARAVANRTDACFIRVIGSELVQKYVGEGARMVRELFEMARTRKACLIFFDEIDAIGGARFDDGAGGDNEVQRTMLELINQLDGFDPRGNIKVLMATNRPDTLDPALMRPGRLDRKVEFGLPDLEGRAHIFKIHARSMSVERDIRFELLARLCPNSTGAEIRSVCTEAGMFAIRARRKVATEKDFLEAINKVIKSYAKFSSTPRYMTYN